MPLLEDSTECTMAEFKDAKEKRKPPWDKLLAAVYILFLCWQLIGMSLYVVRAVKCFKQKLPTYRCDANAAFSHSAEVELCWLVTGCLQIITAIAILQKIADFPGYKAILRHLKSLPQFWSLLFLLLASLSRFAVLSVFSNPNAPFCLPLVISFALGNILRVVAVVFLNFIQLNSLKYQYTKTAFVISKLTLVVMFINNLFRFMMSLLAFSMEVKDFNQHEKIKILSPDLLLVYFSLQKFATTVFHFKIMNFFWQKLFSDNKNVLSEHYSSHSLVE